MDKRTAIKKVNEYINFLKKKKYNITKAYIFGSYVKGTYNDDSDIDIALGYRKNGRSF